MARAILLIPLLALTVSAGSITSCANPCRPWSGKCSKGDAIDLRFAVGDFNCSQPAFMCGTNRYPSQPCTDPSKGCVGYKTHFFCSKVDKFTSLTLHNSAKILNDSFADPRYANDTVEIVNYGGAKNPTPTSVTTPASDDSPLTRAIVFEATHPDCPNHGPAIASFLIYNITLRSGSYGYKNNEAIGNGFTNTCSGPGKNCDFDSSAVCIGRNGNYNCAKCLGSEITPNDDVKVLVTYYGTDGSGETMTSGSSNPINFQQFAVGDVIGNIKDDISGIHFPHI